MKDTLSVQQQTEIDIKEKSISSNSNLPDSPDKFQKLLKKIKTYTKIKLDLTDFGLENNQLGSLVEEINSTHTIKILILRHNNLSDEAAKFLVNLKNIKTLDISYNNFTTESIRRLSDSAFKLHADYNNTLPATIKENRDSLIFQGPSRTDQHSIESTSMDITREQQQTTKHETMEMNIVKDHSILKHTGQSVDKDTLDPINLLVQNLIENLQAIGRLAPTKALLIVQKENLKKRFDQAIDNAFSKLKNENVNP